MSKTTLAIIVYILGLLFGAFFLDIWSADTNPFKALMGIAWTAIFLVAIFFSEKKE